MRFTSPGPRRCTSACVVTIWFMLAWVCVTPLGLAVLPVIIFGGSLNLEKIIWQQASQSHVWNVFFQPLAFLIFMISSFAETNRLPFDLPEAEQELIGGYHTEYGALKLGLFFIGE